eukprot:1160373-Pelagomonas_calceolata.AAC.2
MTPLDEQRLTKARNLGFKLFSSILYTILYPFSIKACSKQPKRDESRHDHPSDGGKPRHQGVSDEGLQEEEEGSVDKSDKCKARDHALF